MGKYTMNKTITKVALIVKREDGRDQVLLLKKKNLNQLILPGGKPEPGESDVETLVRELKEELEVELDQTLPVEFLGTFRDTAAGERKTKILLKVYEGNITRTPLPHREIEGICWWYIAQNDNPVIAPSLRNSILPLLQGRYGISPLPKCETTNTPRLGCGYCDTYPGNLGPCQTWEEGSNGRCVYCDHAKECHPTERKDQRPRR